MFHGYDLKHKIFNSDIELIHDLEPLEVTDANAKKFKKEHGDKCNIWAGEGSQLFVKLKGARVYIPKAISYDHLVAGQLPNGWDATQYSSIMACSMIPCISVSRAWYSAPAGAP